MPLVGILTVSDRSSEGVRPDASGPALEKRLASSGLQVRLIDVVPDEIPEIIRVLTEWCDIEGLDLILTTGGTGVSPRDVTPEATLEVVSKVIPGMGEVMRGSSLQKTPHAMISRAIAGVRGKTLIINLPGSPKGAVENLEAVLQAIPHAISKIQGDPTDCAPN